MRWTTAQLQQANYTTATSLNHSTHLRLTHPTNDTDLNEQHSCVFVLLLSESQKHAPRQVGSPRGWEPALKLDVLLGKADGPDK